MYDLFMTAYISLGLIGEGLFVPTAASPFALQGFGSFVAAGFAGMYVGTLLFGWFSDRFGRRAAFTYSLLWYACATLVMALMRSAPAIDLWRFIAGIGIGVQLITIDAYISELAPKEERGYWIAFSQFIGYLAIPAAALLAYVLVPHRYFGLAGWRYVAMAGSLGGAAVWFLRAGLPETPRWIEARKHHRHGSRPSALATIFGPRYRRRTIVLTIFNFMQTIGFYGFASWVPVLLASEGITFTKSLEYTFIIAIVNPAGPLVAMYASDRWQRKWQIAGLAAFIAAAGLAFSQARQPMAILLSGACITLANAWFSSVFHSYQAELFPTRIRAQAIGFVYSWSRFSSIFAGFLIAAVLRAHGTSGVFAAIAAAMVIAGGAVALFGPRSNKLALEELAAD